MRVRVRVRVMARVRVRVRVRVRAGASCTSHVATKDDLVDVATAAQPEEARMTTGSSGLLATYY